MILALLAICAAILIAVAAQIWWLLLAVLVASSALIVLITGPAGPASPAPHTNLEAVMSQPTTFPPLTDDNVMLAVAIGDNTVPKVAAAFGRRISDVEFLAVLGRLLERGDLWKEPNDWSTLHLRAERRAS